MAIVTNYSKANVEDKRLYTIQGSVISKNGISYRMILVSSILIFIFNLFGIIFCAATGKLYYFMLNDFSTMANFYIITFVIPLIIAGYLCNAKLYGYPAIEYFIMVIKKKIAIDNNGNKIKISAIREDGFVELL